jgi:hypothetical protein
VNNVFNYLSLRVVKAERSHDKGHKATSKRSRYHYPQTWSLTTPSANCRYNNHVTFGSLVLFPRSQIQIFSFAFCSHSQHSVQSSSSAVFPNPSSMGESLAMKTFTDQNKKRQLLTYGNHSRIANCRTKIFVTFPGIFGIFNGIWKCWCIYSTISRGNPNGVLRNLVGKHSFGMRQLHKHSPN